MGYLYNQDGKYNRWNEFNSIFSLFNKGDGHRITYTVHQDYYKYLTSIGVGSYDTVNNKPLKHDGDDFIAITSGNVKLPKNTYQALMVFESMKCVDVTRNSTNTVVFQGYDTSHNLHEIRLAHGTNIIAEEGKIYKRGNMLLTVSDTGVKKAIDNSHLHVTYKVNGKIKSLGALLSGLEPFPKVTHDGKEEEIIMDNFKYVNYKDGNTSQRTVPAALFVWVKKGFIPKIAYERSELANGTIIYGYKIEQNENVVIAPAYSEVRKSVMNLRNQWFENNGYELAFACNTSYFEDNASSANNGLLTGGMLIDWSKSWSKFKSIDLYPTKGKGYPTLWSDGWSLHVDDEWLDPFFSDKVKKGQLYWAMAVGQSNYVEGKHDRYAYGKENGRAGNREQKATIGWCKDGSFCCIGYVGTGVTMSQRQDYSLDLATKWGVYTLLDCDGNGSTFMAFNMDIIKNGKSFGDPTTPEPDEPEAPPTDDKDKKISELENKISVLETSNIQLEETVVALSNDNATLKEKIEGAIKVLV